jgi:hypothetical protein
MAMKYAIDERGSPVQAEVGATGAAFCPWCGALLVLRRRQRGYPRGNTTYFWRHADNTGLNCPSRPSVASRVQQSADPER